MNNQNIDNSDGLREDNVNKTNSIDKDKRFIQLFTDEELELLRRAQASPNICVSGCGDDLASGYYNKVSHDTSYLLSAEDSRELFEKHVLNPLKSLNGTNYNKDVKTLKLNPSK